MLKKIFFYDISLTFASIASYQKLSFKNYVCNYVIYSREMMIAFEYITHVLLYKIILFINFYDICITKYKENIA